MVEPVVNGGALPKYSCTMLQEVVQPTARVRLCSAVKPPRYCCANQVNKYNLQDYALTP